MTWPLILLLLSFKLGEGLEINRRTKRAAFPTCEIAAKSCVGHFRDSDSYPNIAEGFKGYDIILGNLILGDNDDAGYRSLIFDEEAERSGPVRFNNIAGHSTKSCTKNFESTFINNVDDFLQSTVRTDSTDGSRQVGQEVNIVGSLEGKVHGSVNAKGEGGFSGEAVGGLKGTISGNTKGNIGGTVKGELKGDVTAEVDVGATGSATAGGKFTATGEAYTKGEIGASGGLNIAGLIKIAEVDTSGEAGGTAGGSAEVETSGTLEVTGGTKFKAGGESTAGVEGSSSLEVEGGGSLEVEGQTKFGVSTNLEAGTELGAEGGGSLQATATFPPLHQSLSSNSKALTDIAQKIEAKELSITRTWTQCSEYTYTFQGYSPPSFHSGFRKGLTVLNKCWNGTDERACGKNFIKIFGTHFVKEATFGARKVTTRQFNREKAELVDKNEIEQCSSQDSEDSLVGITWGSGKKTCRNGTGAKNALAESGFEKKTTYTVGKGLEGWGEGTVPRMIRKTLAPLSDLFHEDYMEDLAINYSAIKPWIEDKILSYCDLFKPDHHCNFVVKRPYCPPPSCKLANCSAGLYTGPLDRNFLPHGRGTLSIIQPEKQIYTLDWQHGCTDATDGVWSSWSEWSGCKIGWSSVCGKGKSSRTRKCEGRTTWGKKCSGPSSQKRTCISNNGCSGTLSSPNFPSIYQNNYDKTEAIMVKDGYLVQIKFVHFDVEETFGCLDYVTIMDGDGTILMDRTCGSSPPPVIYSRTKAVYITFHTSGQVARRGWKLEWQRAA